MSPVETQIRHAVMPVVTNHWHAHNLRGLPQCGCGKVVEDINAHLAELVYLAVLPFLASEGAGYTIRTQYGEKIEGIEGVLPLPDGHAGATRYATHTRRIIAERDWTPIPT